MASKTLPKKWFGLLQTSSLLLQLYKFVKCSRFLQELNSKGLYLSSLNEKKKENRCLVFTSPLKLEIRKFHVVVARWRQRNVRKRRDARAKLLFCLSNLLLFCRSSCLRRCLSSLLSSEAHAHSNSFFKTQFCDHCFFRLQAYFAARTMILFSGLLLSRHLGRWNRQSAVASPKIF